jgi:hypothetical protein
VSVGCGEGDEVTTMLYVQEMNRRWRAARWRPVASHGGRRRAAGPSGPSGLAERERQFGRREENQRKM